MDWTFIGHLYRSPARQDHRYLHPMPRLPTNFSAHAVLAVQKVCVSIELVALSRFLYIQEIVAASPMRFEWDAEKARTNKIKHRVAFESIERFDFNTALYESDDAIDHGEERWIATGLIGVQVYVLVFTERDDAIRLISLRAATPREARNFYER